MIDPRSQDALMREPRTLVQGRYLVWMACMVFVPGIDCPPDAATCATAPDEESVRFNSSTLTGKVEAVEPLE